MKLAVENVAGIACAEIELDGVTVVAGYNGTGKSTLSKSLYALTDAFFQVDKKVLDEKKHSLAFALKSWGINLPAPNRVRSSWMDDCDRVAEAIVRAFCDGEEAEEACTRIIPREAGDRAVLEPEALQNIAHRASEILNRSESEYKRFIVERSIRAAFRQQVNALGKNVPARLEIKDEREHLLVCFRDNLLAESTEESYYGQPPVYISTVNVLDVISQDPDEVSYIDRLQCLIQQPKREEELTFEEYRTSFENQKAVREMLSEIVEGRLVRENGKIRFFNDRLHANIDFSNIASGLKTFVIIQSLIENGVLTEGSLLIIDEPEVNLHPEWQLKFAEILVNLYKKLGIRMLLNTHSPYFLRAIEIYLAEYEAADRGRFYYMEERDGVNYCADVTDRTEIIYKALYNPLENL